MGSISMHVFKDQFVMETYDTGKSRTGGNDVCFWGSTYVLRRSSMGLD